MHRTRHDLTLARAIAAKFLDEAGRAYNVEGQSLKDSWKTMCEHHHSEPSDGSSVWVFAPRFAADARVDELTAEILIAIAEGRPLANIAASSQDISGCLTSLRGQVCSAEQ
jgi:hypothetical protein